MRLDDTMAQSYFGQGIAHEELGHQREAYFDYFRASELAPEWTDPKQELERFTVIRR